MNPEATEHPDSIAVIGMAARLPGADDIPAFWADLREGMERVERHTREEMIARGAAEPLVDDPAWVNASAPLRDPDAFDAAFFGHAAREASTMDPQHRIFLECAYHAMEESGYDTERYDGLIGVYAGATMNTYVHYNLMPNGEVFDVIGDLQTMIGNDKDFLATRVSYKLDLRGPSLSVQTACSSSLVAVHMACRALLDDECDMALAGGSSLRMPHGAGYLANPGGTSAPDGHCRAFDEDSGGSVPGSGAGAVVLKRLADALRDGDHVHAVIRGTAVNNDGRSKASFTAPSVDGQARVMIRALQRAGLTARDIDYVEAHGTGTPLGDPIEVAALTRAFRADTDERGYCLLGSVKPNIGHLDAAAGIAGLIKTSLVLKHRKVPPVVNFRRPNPKLELETTPFTVPGELTPLDGEGPLHAMVNSLGMGGTNAHAILEEPPALPAGGPSRRRQPVLLSAKTPEALEQMSQALGRWMRENPTAHPADVAYTLAVGRRRMEHRRTVIATDLEDASYALTTPGSSRQRTTEAVGSARTALVFPGQGTQRACMGGRLTSQEPRFAAHLEHCLTLFAERAGVDLRHLVGPDARATDEAQQQLVQTELTQPALFAVEWALGRTLLDLGGRPQALLGHSIGEWVAATLAGVFTLEDAVELVALRGRLMAESVPGAMLYVHLSEAEVERRLPEALTVAAVNAPELVVVAGDTEAVAAFHKQLQTDGVSAGPLAVTRAFHSPLIAKAAEQLCAAVAERTLSAPTLPVVSNVTGRLLDADRAVDPAYWAEQMRLPVRFAQGVRTVADQGVELFLEAGPGHALTTLIQAAGWEGAPPACRTVLETGGKEPQDLLDTLTHMWSLGVDVDWSAYYASEDRRRVSLPLYPFARTRFWLDPAPGGPARTAAATGTGPARLESDRWLHRPTWRLRPLIASEAADGAIVSVRTGVAGEVSDEVVALDRADGGLTAEDLAGHGPLTLLLPVDVGADAVAAVEVLRKLAASVAAHTGQDRPVRLVVRTAGAARIDAAGGGLIAPTAAALAAAARVAAQEVPQLATCLLDGADAESAALRVVTARDTGTVLAEREGLCWESTYSEAPATSSEDRPIAGWLLIGGAGAFGRAFASRVLADGARKAVVLDLESDGGRPLSGPVEYVTGDARDPQVLEAALDRLGGIGPVGVLHAAGLSGESGIGPLTVLDSQAVGAQFDVRAGIARTLAEVVGGRTDIDRVVLLSSLSVPLGGVGGFGYAAASAWLDGYAHSRDRTGGTRWSSVQWEHWQDGPADPRDPRAAYALDEAQLVQSISRLLSAPAAPVLAVATADPAARAAGATPRAARPAADTRATGSAAPVPDEPSAARLSPIQQLLADIWIELLGVEQVRPQDNFFDLGGHSLLAMQLITRLRRELGTELPMITLFETPTLAALAAHLEELGLAPSGRQSAAAEPVSAPAPPAPSPSEDDDTARLAAQVEAMSDEEVQRLLASFEAEEDQS
ncbi:type I polyketide synthase [Streptomyces sp. HK10]|uniref:type I polyketide synthase n=1 Tax=Streptomyces sp. HK10 TaxID=3373255 RepID=UPI00374A6793